MRLPTYKALLVIADISGFTQFMKSHEDDANYAMQVVVELLRAVISAAAAPLKLVEVEGDAAFFYAICNEDSDRARELAAIKKQVTGFFRAFHQTLQRLGALYPSVRGAQELRLKVVIHAGEVAREHIHGFDKLFGMDVILAHRLLKNSVPAREYVLLTEAAYKRLGDFYPLQPERQAEYCEGIGVVETVVFYPPAPIIHTGKMPVGKFQSAGSNFSMSAHALDHARQPSPDGYLFSAPLRDQARAPLQGSVWLPQLQTKWRREAVIHGDHQGRQELRCGPSP